ncbi:septal ring lytic transglycosylase RlpA family protein [Rhizobium sp. TRM95796]|uniref:septal ring lytic transglycosylase RlpA family protein n=1 Tax=Rhizobium sp. TRM95796 TaxID=2979862 RepID=UPI0021E7BA88|nr:septal ring lytic transglycosylase RlpA family protein [Rhizobium sp. TRM95796]MCV3764034.1 septal ring lytic transglycosylase RlpA family protein [Rhizobium sp. TRM95796]
MAVKTERRGAPWAGAGKWTALAVLCLCVASCGTTKTVGKKRSHGKEYFAESEYGVKASPRVYKGKHPPKGGGREMVGKPYKVKGKWYQPKEDKSYNKVGLASWYGSAFHGRLTANGEIYDQYSLSAAHPTFPLPSYARVTNLQTGSSLIVRVNDRGPYHPGRIIDISDKAADMLDMRHHGTAKVQVQYVGRARLDGRDQAFLMASYIPKGERIRRNPGGQIATGVMVASNDATFTPSQVVRAAPVVPKPAVTRVASVAYVEPAATPAWAGDLSEFETMVQLPDFGPVPVERPQYTGQSLGTLSAYAEMRVETAQAAPFDAVLVGRGGLNAEAIRKSVERRN